MKVKFIIPIQKQGFIEQNQKHLLIKKKKNKYGREQVNIFITKIKVLKKINILRVVETEYFEFLPIDVIFKSFRCEIFIHDIMKFLHIREQESKVKSFLLFFICFFIWKIFKENNKVSLDG